MRDISDNGLATFIHRPVFDDDALLALAAIPLEGFDLRRESSGKLVQGSFVNVHLFQSSGSLKAARLRHRRHVNSVAVSRRNAERVIPRLRAVSNRRCFSSRGMRM